MKIPFDINNTTVSPTFVLATKSGKKFGGFEPEEIHSISNFNSADEMTFVLQKYKDNKITSQWDNMKDFRLVFVPEWDMWYEIAVEINEGENGTSKNVTATSLCEAELSQLVIYNTQINTEDDIDREAYVNPTVFYNPFDTDASLLHRIMEKAKNYTITHVDKSIMNIQRTFEFDDVSIYDAFQEISEEIGCIFVFNNGSKNGNPAREIAIYDLQSHCENDDCNYREEDLTTSKDLCSKCGGNMIDGYGEDTTIFVTSDELADDLTLITEVDSVKNCFKLEAGDDYMTSTIRICNPNGSDYIWHITPQTKEDMSYELQDRLDSYDVLYKEINEERINSFDTDNYNNLVIKYKDMYDSGMFKEDFYISEINSEIKGFPDLITAFYNTIDFKYYLEDIFMPTTETSGTNAEIEANKLTHSEVSPVAVSNLKIASEGTIQSAALSIAKTIIDARYSVKVIDIEVNKTDISCTANITYQIKNYSDEEDYYTTTVNNVIITDDVETFVKRKIDIALAKVEADDVSVSGVFGKLIFKTELELEEANEEFANNLKNYCLNTLMIFQSAAKTCQDILIENGSANDANSDIYKRMYFPILNKIDLIDSEIYLREQEIKIIDDLGNLISEIILDLQDELNFEDYLGSDLWNEMCLFRREDKYINDNYISDGLNSAQVVSRALEFYETAKKEIFKSSELQHKISSSLRNLLLIPKFKPLVNYFELGNFIRVRIDDEIYKLRLINYEIDFDNLQNISVEFSDVIKNVSGENDIESILNQASQMASTYSYIAHQASKGNEASEEINSWVANSLNATNVNIVGGATGQEQIWDEHGLLLRQYDTITDSFNDIQTKIINSGIYTTKDNWKTAETALGRIVYKNPEYDYDSSQSEYINDFGIVAKKVIGQLILGEELGIYTSNGKLKFDEYGLNVSNDTNTIKINPTGLSEDGNICPLFEIKNGSKQILYLKEDGNLYLDGSMTIANNSDDSGIKLNQLVSSVKVLYTITENQNDIPSNSEDTIWNEDEQKIIWHDTISPDDIINNFIWQITIATYTDGTHNITSPSIISTINNSEEDNYTIISMKEQFFLSESDSQIPSDDDSNWSDEQTWESNKFIWTRSEITLSNGIDTKVTYTSPVLANALNNAITSATNANATANSVSNTLSSLTTTENNVTVIDGGKIKTGSITADSIDTSTLTASAIFGDYIQSTNFDLENKTGMRINLTNGEITTGSNNFSVSSSGILTANYLKANNADISGHIEATSGTFNGTIYATDGEFSGELKAATGSFAGAVTATSLTLGSGVTISADDIDGLDLDEYLTNDDLKGYVTNEDLNKKGYAYSSQLNNYITHSETGNFIKIATPLMSENGEEYGYFEVSTDGLLQAKNAVIEGTIHATSGYFIGTVTTQSHTPLTGGYYPYSRMTSDGFTGIGYIYDSKYNNCATFRPEGIWLNAENCKALSSANTDDFTGEDGNEIKTAEYADVGFIFEDLVEDSGLKKKIGINGNGYAHLNRVYTNDIRNTGGYTGDGTITMHGSVKIHKYGTKSKTVLCGELDGTTLTVYML